MNNIDLTTIITELIILVIGILIWKYLLTGKKKDTINNTTNNDIIGKRNL
jgi:hypothetical protein